MLEILELIVQRNFKYFFGANYMWETKAPTTVRTTKPFVLFDRSNSLVDAFYSQLNFGFEIVTGTSTVNSK